MFFNLSTFVCAALNNFPKIAQKLLLWVLRRRSLSIFLSLHKRWEPKSSRGLASLLITWAPQNVSSLWIISDFAGNALSMTTRKCLFTQHIPAWIGYEPWSRKVFSFTFLAFNLGYSIISSMTALFRDISSSVSLCKAASSVNHVTSSRSHDSHCILVSFSNVKVIYDLSLLINSSWRHQLMTLLAMLLSRHINANLIHKTFELPTQKSERKRNFLRWLSCSQWKQKKSRKLSFYNWCREVRIKREKCSARLEKWISSRPRFLKNKKNPRMSLPCGHDVNDLCCELS